LGSSDGVCASTPDEPANSTDSPHLNLLTRRLVDLEQRRITRLNRRVAASVRSFGCAGWPLRTDAGWQRDVPCDALHEDYVQTMEKAGVSRRAMETELGMQLRELAQP